MLGASLREEQAPPPKPGYQRRKLDEVLRSLPEDDRRRCEAPLHLAATNAAAEAREAALSRGEPRGVAEAEGAVAVLDAALAARWAAAKAAANGVSALSSNAATGLAQANQHSIMNRFEQTLMNQRIALTLDTTNGLPRLQAAKWLAQVGNDTAADLHRENFNSYLLSTNFIDRYDAPPLPGLSMCWYTYLPASVLPALPYVPAGHRDEAALEQRIVSALNAVSGPVGSLLDDDACELNGSPLFTYSYVARPQRAVLEAFRKMQYRAFAPSLEYVADHLRPMFGDVRGEKPVGWGLRTPGALTEQEPIAERAWLADEEYDEVVGRLPDDVANAWAALVRLSSASPQARIRVAVVDAHMTENHAVTKSFGSILGALDPSEFDVSLFWLHPEHDPAKHELLDQGAGMVVHNISTLSMAEQFRSIAAWVPHIVVHTSQGMTGVSDRVAMARLAPVQLLLMGHGATSGLGTIDVFMPLADVNAAEARLFTEREVMPTRAVGTRRRRPSLPAPERARSRAEFGLPEDAHIYLCAQTLMKVHTDMDGAIDAILAADPLAVVVFIETPGRPQFGLRLLDRLVVTNIRHSTAGTGRIVLLPTVPKHPHGRGYDLLEHYRDLLVVADVVLDTWPFGGATSTLECLAMGKPVVTLPSTTDGVGRITLMYYNHIGVHGLVASDWVRLGLLCAARAVLTRSVPARRSMSASLCALGRSRGCDEDCRPSFLSALTCCSRMVAPLRSIPVYFARMATGHARWLRPRSPRCAICAPRPRAKCR